MFVPRSLRYFPMILVLVLAALACSLGGGTPTPTAVPPPTDVPAEPTKAPEPTQAAEATSAPPPPDTGGTAPLEIIMVNGFLDNFESWNVVGLVKNNTERVVDSIEIEVEIFDASGNSLFKDTAFADLFNIAPGEVTPFSYIVFEDLPDADNFVATIVGNSTTELERAFPDVTNTRMTHDDSGDTHITGEFVNNTDRPITINSLAAATFDSNGEIVTADSYSVSVRYLNPGDSGPFRISITGPNAGVDAIDSFDVFVDAEFSDSIPPFGLTISDAYNYLDSFDNFHLVGEVTNNGDMILSVSMIAGIYDASGVVLDAADISLPVNALAPGETVPYDFDFWGPLNYTSGMIDQADSYSIQVDAYWTWETSTELLDITTQNDSNAFDTFGGEFNGQVLNNSGGPVDNVTVMVYLRDLASGQVIATGYDYVFDEIPDGGTADYTVFIDVPENFDVNSAEAFVIVKAERP